MIEFTPHTQEELKEFNIKENQLCHIKYINKDYFNGEETLEITNATAILTNDKITFLAIDPYGMDKYLDNVRLLHQVI